MSKARVYARNLGANWIGYGANLAVAFFMSPFVVHSLGDARYGVWTLLTSLTGYLGLVDIGVRGGTGRYINYYLGRGEDDEVSNIVTTSLFFYTVISVVVLAASATLAFFFGDIFPKIEPEYVREAQWVLLLLGLNVWIGFISSTFSQLLTAAERFDLQMISDVSVLALKTVATIWILLAGRGLVELALVQVGSGLLGCLQVVVLAWRKGPPVRYHWLHVRWRSLREVFGYGLWSFIANATSQLGLFSSSAIIGMLIGSAEITFFGIGATLIGYASTFVSYVTRVIMPDMLKAGGRGDRGHLRWLMSKGIRATMFLAVPILVGFMTLGGEFISVWMGPGYTASARVLTILAAARLGMLANEPVGMTLLALGHVRFCATMTAVQSFFALVVSVGLVLFTDLGIYGVAIGTALSTIATHNVWLFVAGYRKVGGHLLEAARATALRWVIGACVFAIPCLVVSRELPNGGWLLFWLKVGIVSVIYVPIGLFVVLQRDEGTQIVRHVYVRVLSVVRFLATDRRALDRISAADANPQSGRVDGSQADSTAS
jgi:O-antigen/teichoic acid export membrane protein